MRKRICLSKGFLTKLFLVLGVSFAIVNTQIGCNSRVSDSVAKLDTIKVQNWITLDVKFKPNTNGEMRDKSLRAIEKILVDSLKVLRAGNFPDYSPEMTISR